MIVTSRVGRIYTGLGCTGRRAPAEEAAGSLPTGTTVPTVFKRSDPTFRPWPTTTLDRLPGRRHRGGPGPRRRPDPDGRPGPAGSSREARTPPAGGISW